MEEAGSIGNAYSQAVPRDLGLVPLRWDQGVHILTNILMHHLVETPYIVKNYGKLFGNYDFSCNGLIQCSYVLIYVSVTYLSQEVMVVFFFFLRGGRGGRRGRERILGKLQVQHRA